VSIHHLFVAVVVVDRPVAVAVVDTSLFADAAVVDKLVVEEPM
jgi:hypothetical protein